MKKELERPEKKTAVSKTREGPTLALELNEEGVCETEFQGDWSRLKDAYKHTAVAIGLIGQISCVGSHGTRIDERASNFVLSFVDAMKPKDPAEVLLLTQMATTHQATMMLARRLNHVDNIAQQDSAERALNKLTRSYAAQMSTLKKYRSKGQQVVRVERVTVEDGGQAVVGNVEAGGSPNVETGR